MIDELDGTQITELLASELRGVLIDFWSPWCAPCRVLRPHLNTLAREREIAWRFVAINTIEHPQTAESFSVLSLPTLVLFRRGKELYRFAGSALPSTIDAKLDELG